MNNFAGVYEIVSTTTGHRYVGSAVNIRKRWAIHRCLLKYGKHSKRLQAAFNNHEVFEFHILVACESFEILRYEQWFLDHFQPEYNFCKVAGLAGWKGSKHTEEELVKMRAVQQARSAEISRLMMGKKNSLGKNIGNKFALGKHGTPEESMQRRVELNKILRRTKKRKKDTGGGIVV
jgi:group I intron endonuclease